MLITAVIAAMCHDARTTSIRVLLLMLFISPNTQEHTCDLCLQHTQLIMFPFAMVLCCCLTGYPICEMVSLIDQLAYHICSREITNANQQASDEPQPMKTVT
jgi:hypothetical protein